MTSAANAATATANAVVTQATKTQGMAPAGVSQAAVVGVGTVSVGGMLTSSVVTSFVAPGLAEMSRVPSHTTPEEWNDPTTSWCGAPVMQRGACATLTKLALLPFTIPTYVISVLGWCAVEAWYESSSNLINCLVCPRGSTKARIWGDAMRGSRFGGMGVRRFIAARRALQPSPSCAEAITLNLHSFLALNGKCWCCTCPTHAHQVHGQCVEAPCQVWPLDSDPRNVQQTAGGGVLRVREEYFVNIIVNKLCDINQINSRRTEVGAPGVWCRSNAPLYLTRGSYPLVVSSRLQLHQLRPPLPPPCASRFARFAKGGARRLRYATG